MTPQEQDLITHLLDRLRQAGGAAKDPEAEALIRQAAAAQPDAPYYLVQTVLIQDMALANAQSRIAQLERGLAEAKQAASQPAAQPTSFLGGLFGRVAAGPPAAGPASVPSAGPWSRPAPTPAGYAPSYQAPPNPSQYPPQYQPAMAAGGSSFLRSAATTAAGIAGGALLFEGIQSLFGQHAGGILGNTGVQPGLSETVVNNYYGSDAGTGTVPADQPGGWDQDQAGGAAVPADYAPDPGQDPGTDYGGAEAPDQDGSQDFSPDSSSDQDFGGGDYT